MHTRTLVLLSLGAMASAILAPRSAHAGYVANKYVEPGTGQVLEYNVYVPDAYDPAKKYPILLVMHAASDKNPPQRSLSSDGKGWAETFVASAHQKSDPSFFMVPISQTNSSGWGDPLTPITGVEKFEGRLAVAVLKQVVMAEYNIDPTRLYLTGPSMGGRGTWDILRRYPGMFAAGAPAAAPASPADAAIYANENILAVCGEVDPIVQGARDTILAIRKLGGNPIYMELSGHGHDSWRWLYPDAQFLTWLYAQRLGVPWWTVSQAPKAPLQGGTPPATLSKPFPEAVVAPPNLGTGFGGAWHGSAGASGMIGSSGAGGRSMANGGAEGSMLGMSGSGGVSVAGGGLLEAGATNSAGVAGSVSAGGSAGSTSTATPGIASSAGAAPVGPEDSASGIRCSHSRRDGRGAKGWLVCGLLAFVASARRRAAPSRSKASASRVRSS